MLRDLGGKVIYLIFSPFSVPFRTVYFDVFIMQSYNIFSICAFLFSLTISYDLSFEWGDAFHKLYMIHRLLSSAEKNVSSFPAKQSNCIKKEKYIKMMEVFLF